MTSQHDSPGRRAWGGGSSWPGPALAAWPSAPARPPPDASARPAPAWAATAFGYTSSGGYYTVSTGAGLTFKISQSTGGMTSLNINGTELQPSGTNESHVESGLPSPAVSARQTGSYIIITASTSTWYGSGTLQHYYVAASGQNNIYMATYVGSAGEVRWIQYLNRAILADVIHRVGRPRRDRDRVRRHRPGQRPDPVEVLLQPAGDEPDAARRRAAAASACTWPTASGRAVRTAPSSATSSSRGPAPRWRSTTTCGRATTTLRRSGLGVLHGPYALMVAGTSTPAAPDMSFMTTLGLAGTVAPSGRGYLVGAVSGVTAGAGRHGRLGELRRPVLGRARRRNGDFASPLMKPGGYTQTLYQGELAVATRTVTVTAGATTAGQNMDVRLGHPGQPGLPGRDLGRHPERLPELGRT